MRKTLITVWVLITFFTSRGQPGSHTGFGNTYIYSETDGIDESNFYVAGMASDGRVFLHAHTGSLFVKGNNYTRKIKFPDAAIPLHIAVTEIGTNKFIAEALQYYYFINNDSITKWSKSPNESFDIHKHDNKIIGHNLNKIYLLENDSFVLKYSTALVNGCDRYFYTDSALNIWQVTANNGRANFYRILNLASAEYQFSIPISPQNFTCESIISINSPRQITLIALNGGGLSSSSEILGTPLPTKRQKYYLVNRSNEYSTLVDKQGQQEKRVYIQNPGLIMGRDLYDSSTFSFYFGTYNKPFRYFSYLKKYPHLFNKSNSSGIQAITQDSLGRIWVNSYDGSLNILEDNKSTEFYDKDLKFLNSPLATSSHVYIGSEKAGYRYIQYDLNSRKKGIIANNMHVYFTGLSRNKQQVYLGTGPDSGLYIANVKALDSGNPEWKIINNKKGMKLRSIVSITEDLKGRLWVGNPVRGFALYYPEKNKAKTWLIANGETDFGFWSSCTDDRGTVWLGTGQKGLMFYNDYREDTLNLQKVLRIEHPLLPDGTKIMQITQWGNWLVMGTGRDILLMDLGEWYRTKKVFIRYINPQEGNFTTPPEQNTILIDKRDSTVWFATSDMLYQWDIKKWLSLATYKVRPNILMHFPKGDLEIAETHVINRKPVNNTLKFSVWFQSRDNMPRYMSVALIKRGDSLQFEPPSLQTRFEYPSLAPGRYILVVRICQTDGTVSIHQFPINIRRFWWQYWWVWFAFFLALFTPVVLWIIYLNRARLAKAEAKRKEAELEATKADHQKRLSDLQIVSLSNQFRPHFILNALNTVGAELDNKPQAESVLSRLGESIDLIFSHTNQQKITHSFPDEWRLVKSVIDIHKLMYLKNLEVNLPQQNTIDTLNYIQIPLGLLQVPVENALLHGLSNRETGPWKLGIKIEETEKEIVVSVTDNGVGRPKAATLSNYRKHGTGTKNLNSILEILNNGKTEKINIAYEDEIYFEEDGHYGTKAIIIIPKNFLYEA